MILLSAIIYNLEVTMWSNDLVSAIIYNLEVTIWSNDFVICNNL